MDKINKYADIIVNHYSNYREEDRFLSKQQNIEFLTTMRYIQKYAKPGCKILEVGAGTGAYSISLAKLGFNVTSIELVPKNIEVFKQNAKGVNNLTILQGDALDLSRFEDGEFDIVLNLGPMYHFYREEDKLKAVKESLRVCKSDGYAMFAYISHAAIVWNYGVRKNCMSLLEYAIEEDGKITDVPEEVFSSFYVEDFKKLFKNTNSTYITNVATDSVSRLVREEIENDLSEKDYNILLKYHFSTCEREDQQGLSNHLLYICKKN